MLTSLSKSSIAANVILATLACTAVALRLVARHQRKLPLKADDYAIILALASPFVKTFLSKWLTMHLGYSARRLYCRCIRGSYQPLDYPGPDNDNSRVLEIGEGRSSFDPPNLIGLTEGIGPLD